MNTLQTQLKNITAAVSLTLAVSFGASAATEVMIAYGNQPGEPIDKAMQYWAEQVNEKSNGEIQFRLFPSSQLGSETEVMEQAKFGANIITISSYGYLMDTVPDLGIINAPYLSQSFEKKSKLLHTEWFQGLNNELSDKGLKIVVPDVVYGTRHLLSKGSVTSPDDLKGVKVRVQHSRLFVATVKAMGGVPTPMSLADVYPGLSQGVIEGVENPAVVLQGGKFYEVVKNLNLTAHTKHMSPFVAGSMFWNQLSEKEQKIILETSRDMVSYGATLIAESEQEAIDQLKSEGVAVNEVDIQAFEESARKVVQAEFPEWSPNLYKNVQDKLAQL
ncbi:MULTISPECIES: C4-dicarboxylate TRAP transporter substrate-binding protein [Vibrio]|uniref:C4-dicarboxylate TRAP transporter substrate-binding protein n=1 Tax=Vibrio splendidus TaxID=29497 RepID=A0ABD5A9M0_VIBSP|nr:MULTISPECIES: C4-dicarboxylate TRAP transporter substrate-binding protein [Vibrio]MDP2489785.1 C4-dicarboxylate TRAP transporter substrate-binding protein [Vibrio splendidus]PMO56232.1 C4-dicarboxylate ABC transporter [Vibrio splendidus]